MAASPPPFDVNQLTRLVDVELLVQCAHTDIPNAVLLLRQVKTLRALDAFLSQYLGGTIAAPNAVVPRIDAAQEKSVSHCCDSMLSFFLQHYAHDACYVQNKLLSLRLRELTLLVLAKLYSFRLLTLESGKRARILGRAAEHFPSVCAEDAVYAAKMPIFEMDQHSLLMSLYAVFVRSPEALFSTELYQYTLLLLWSAMHLLVSVGDKYTLNVEALRTKCYNNSGAFRFSQRFSTNVGILLRAFMRKFSAVCEFSPLVFHEAPSILRQLYIDNDQDVRAIEQWLRACSRRLPSLFVQQNYSKMVMRAGECDFYELEESSAYVEQAVLQRYRPIQFVQFMEDTLRLPQQIIDQELAPLLDGKIVREPVGLALVALDTLLERLRALVPGARAENYVMLEWQMTAYGGAAGIDTIKRSREPMLVYVFNAVQLWDGARMHMYNSALRALSAWAHLVLSPRFNATLAQADARALCEEMLAVRKPNDRAALVGECMF